MKKIPISEIFESIQWEWINTWKPSIFVRFWGCNLACTWCDSKYSWDSKIEKANIKSLNEVIAIIKTFKSKHIIFTWWEPTLFQIHIKDIQKELKDYTYELETNWSNKITNWIHFNQINVSPKLLSSWNKKYDLNILKTNIWLFDNMDLKFVCWNEKTIKETEKFIKEIGKDENYNIINNIYIMPLWRDSKSQINSLVLKYCLNKWYNYCLRQHLILFWDWKWK